MSAAKLTAFLLASAASVLGGNIQINYYYDGGCTDFASSPPDIPFQDYYNWQTPGANSANIADCTYSTCQCIFYTQPNGGGPQQPTAYGGYDNMASCASNWGQGFASFWCSWAYIIGRDENGKDIYIEEDIKGNLGEYAAIPWDA